MLCHRCRLRVPFETKNYYIRAVSTTSAINRGLRATKTAADTRRKPLSGSRKRDTHGGVWRVGPIDNSEPSHPPAPIFRNYARKSVYSPRRSKDKDSVTSRRLDTLVTAYKRLNSLLGTIQKHEATDEYAGSQLQQVEVILKYVNSSIQAWELHNGGSSDSNDIRLMLKKMVKKERYLVDTHPDRTKSVIIQKLDGLFEFVLSDKSRAQQLLESPGEPTVLGVSGAEPRSESAYNYRDQKITKYFTEEEEQERRIETQQTGTGFSQCEIRNNFAGGAWEDKRLWDSNMGFGAQQARSNFKRVSEPKTGFEERPAGNGTKRRETGDGDLPISVPYTTAASVFLYGSNVVLAALRTRRRKLYKLYIYQQAFDRVKRFNKRPSKDTPLTELVVNLVSLAKEAGIPLEKTSNNRLLDKMSDGRAHNGVVLEASRIPAPPVLSLSRTSYSKSERRTSVIPLQLQHQSDEDKAVNGAPTEIPALSRQWRYPLVVLLDGITDPGNLGNILRTCHFYGVDAVAVATNTCANLSSPVVAKASSGACEAIPILALPEPASFAYYSKREWWQIIAAVPEMPEHRDVEQRDNSLNKYIRPLRLNQMRASSPLQNNGCILMLGSEGEGLRENLLKRASFRVTIPKGHHGYDVPDPGVDSVNVAVAAGVLLEALLTKPASART